MDFNLTETLSMITLIVSFVSPIAVSVVNNAHAERMARMKEYDTRRQEAIANYIRSAGASIDSSDESAFEKYRASYGEVFLYASPELWENIRLLDAMLYKIAHEADTSYVRNSSSELFSEICQSLSSGLPRKEQNQRHRQRK